MQRQAEMFKQSGIVTLCVFRSTPINIERYGPAVGKIFLSDKKGCVFKSYMVPKSTRAMIAGCREGMKNYSKYKQNVSFSGIMKDSDPKGSNQLPADFMIDENGVIVDLFRAERITEHMPWERIETFIPKDKRCKCNKKDCIVSCCYCFRK